MCVIKRSVVLSAKIRLYVSVSVRVGVRVRVGGSLGVSARVRVRVRARLCFGLRESEPWFWLAVSVTGVCGRWVMTVRC